LKKEADKTLALKERTCKGRKPYSFTNVAIVELRDMKYTVAKIADKLNVSESQVKLIFKREKAGQTA